LAEGKEGYGLPGRFRPYATIEGVAKEEDVREEGARRGQEGQITLKEGKGIPGKREILRAPRESGCGKAGMKSLTPLKKEMLFLERGR